MQYVRLGVETGAENTDTLTTAKTDRPDSNQERSTRTEHTSPLSSVENTLMLAYHRVIQGAPLTMLFCRTLRNYPTERDFQKIKKEKETEDV